MAETHSETSTFDSSDDSDFNYRSLSRAAVLSVVFGLFGILAWLTPLMIFLPICAIVFAYSAFGNLRKYPNELVGATPAAIGLVLGLVMTIAAPAWHTYVYYTEVPEGYKRISFYDLTSPKNGPDVPTQQAIMLNGEKIFVKGYVHPTSVSGGATKSFVLVPDLGTCCFGTQPPLTHMIEVRLVNGKYASQSLRQYALAGALVVRPNLKQVDGLTGVFYEMEAEHFQ
jgi:hypothetical protein